MTIEDIANLAPLEAHKKAVFTIKAKQKMPDLTRRFVKCGARYHLLTLEDVEYFQKHNQWPDKYDEIDWEKELAKGDFITLRQFFKRKPTHEQAYNAAYFADAFGIPVFKKVIDSRFGTVNIFPKYFLKEFFSK